MESTSAPKRSGKWIKGMQKVPTFGDIAEIEALNAKTYFWQPERYVFQAPKIAEASSQIEKELEEQKVRVVREIHRHNDDRMGDNPVIVREMARGEQGVRGDPGPRGVEGMQGVEGPRGPPGPPGAALNLDPVIDFMERRLREQERVREEAQNRELQNELSHIRAETERQRNISEAMARHQAQLTSIPHELRVVADATVRQPVVVDVTQHLRDAASHIARQQQQNHEASMHFLQRNAQDLAQFAVQVGAGISSALDGFKPPKREAIEVTPAPPPPPPPPDGGRVRKAAKAIEDKGPHKPPEPRDQPVPPPAKAHAPGTSPPRLLPPGSMPGSSTDRPRTFDFGGPSTETPEERRRREEANRKKWDERSVEQFYIGDKKPAPRIQHTGKIVKEKTKNKKSAGVSQQVTVPDHQEKLTKHGKKPVVVETKEEDKPEPHVQHRRDIDYVREKRKGAPQPKRSSILRKRPLESGPAPKKQRRVSAHQV